MNHPTAQCRCGFEWVIQPNAKLFTSCCGMAFQTYEAGDKEFRYHIQAEDLRDAAMERRPADVVADVRERAEELARDNHEEGG